MSLPVAACRPQPARRNRDYLTRYLASREMTAGCSCRRGEPEPNLTLALLDDLDAVCGEIGRLRNTLRKIGDR